MSAKAEVPAAQLGYAEALAELEEINEELDGDEVDVDVLGARVRRAAELLRLCRERIAGARFEVEQVVAELEAEVEAATATAAAAAAAVAAAEAAPPDPDDTDEPDEP
jgi:exodeoxyribonuclease VII small subunit